MSVPFSPSFLLTAYRAVTCQSKHFPFVDSFVSRDGHLTLFWTMGCKNESLEDLGITFAFPDPGTTFSSLLVPSPHLECKWELVEQIPMGDLNRLELSSLPLDILSLWTVVGLPLVTVVRFLLHVVKSNP